jgi:hypothetical protein
VSHLVKIGGSGLTNVQVGHQVGDTGEILTITDEEYADIPAANLDGNPLIDMGEDVVGSTVLSFPVAFPLPVGAADIVTNFVLQGHGKITQFAFVVVEVGAGAGATRAVNLEIGSTNLVGGVLTLTLANTTPVGNVVVSTAITGNNEFNDGDTVSIEVAAGGTAFTGGRGVFLITVE